MMVTMACYGENGQVVKLLMLMVLIQQLGVVVRQS